MKRIKLANDISK